MLKVFPLCQYTAEVEKVVVIKITRTCVRKVMETATLIMIVLEFYNVVTTTALASTQLEVVNGMLRMTAVKEGVHLNIPVKKEEASV
jgi:hypothetical protein